MLPPMTKSTFHEHLPAIHDAYVAASHGTMKQAIDEEPGDTMNDTYDIDVSVDGTWQRRGYSSLNGVVAIISANTGKCVDTEVLSKTCKGCQYWKGKEEQIGYLSWLNSHECAINFDGAAGSMEKDGVISIFKRSILLYNIRYKTYIGDGDTSSYQAMVKSKPYGEFIPWNDEYVGHVQKRIGSRLRKLKAEDKSLGGRGKGKLNQTVIDSLQNSMGLAIRQNIGNLEAMRLNVGALLFHYSEANTLEGRHQFCPKTADSW